MLKIDELANPSSCLNKADLAEPIFVLRANDPIAAEVVEFWATRASGIHESQKIDEANNCAKKFRLWRDAHIMHRS